MDSKYKQQDDDSKPWTSGDASAPDTKKHQGMVYAIQNPFTGRMIYPTKGKHWADGQDVVLQTMNE